MTIDLKYFKLYISKNILWFTIFGKGIYFRIAKNNYISIHERLCGKYIMIWNIVIRLLSF